MPVKALEAPKFKSEALPAELSITYQLTSAMADGRAVYNWSRDGDDYRITGEAEAIGFFTLMAIRLDAKSNALSTPKPRRCLRFPYASLSSQRT